MLAEMHWEAAEHLAYGSDLAPYDFYMLGTLEEALGDLSPMYR